MVDGPTAENDWVVPLSAPIRMYEWLTPPLFLVGLAAIELFAALGARSSGAPVFSVAAVSVSIIAAVALWIFGYRAYRDLTARAVQSYFVVAIASLFTAGVLLNIGWILLFFAGRLTVERRFRRARLLGVMMPRRLWRRTAIVAAIVGVVCLFLSPLVHGLDLVPLIPVVWAGRVVAPFVLGLAWRLQSGPTARF